MTENVVIIGAGHAGVQLAVSLRDAGFEGGITLVSEETDPPYQRPPLSKGFLLGKQDTAALCLKSPEVYADLRIDCVFGDRAVRLNRAERQVVLESDRRLPYNRVALATGGRRASLPVSGIELDGVVGLRSFTDAAGIKTRLANVKNAVVIGGGFIGLEFAAVARSLGISVVLVETAPRLLGRSTSEIVARHIEQVHVSQGVDIRFGEQVLAMQGTGHLQHVQLRGGAVLPADLALVGVGMTPNVDLAVSAGLGVLDGILVDEHLRTSDPDILALGDCARFPTDGAMVRLESVQNATDQAKHAAETIMGRLSPFLTAPWFWSDQGTMKLQIAGLAQGADRHVVRGSSSAQGFSVFCFRGDRLVAVESVNRGPDHVMARRLLAAGATLTDHQAGDENFPLKSLLTKTPDRSSLARMH